MKNEQKYNAVKIHVKYQTTKSTEILINFLTGVFLVKGSNYMNWIDDEIPKLLEINSLHDVLNMVYGVSQVS